MSDSIDIGLVAAHHRVEMWLREYARLEELDQRCIHSANGYELRTEDLRRIVAKLNEALEIGKR